MLTANIAAVASDMTLHDFVFPLTIGLYALAVYNCIRIVGARMSPGAALAWILINLLLPFIGVPLYFLFGDFRIRGYVKRHRAGAQKVEAALDGESSNASAQRPSTEPAGFGRVFSKLGPVYRPKEGGAELLVDGASTFEAIFAAIAKAERYILVQYYILRADRLGLELKRLLMQKARNGLPVFLLYDDMGSFWLSREYIRDLKGAGVRVVRFLPIASFKRFFQLNFRNHRKLVVVDGLQAFTGGLNVGEEYAAPRKRRQKTKAMRRYWRDTHMRLTGAAVLQLEEIFLEDWHFATGEKIDLQKITLATNSINAKPLPQDQIIQVIPTGPTDETLVSILYLLHVITMARSRLWVATPYFVPDQTIIRALELAALRGVDVRIMLPQQSDNSFVHWVSLSYGELMQQKGSVVLLYQAGFMHQKVILADDNFALVGTMNIDNRALYLNFETMVAVHGTTFNESVERMLLTDFLSCRFLQHERQPIRRAFIRARANVARLLAPLL